MKLIDAKKEATMLLEKTKQKKPPVNLEKILDYLGIVSCPYDFTSVGASNVSGYIHKTEGKSVIWVDFKEIKTRQRFTIAHEIGHYLQHMDEDEISYIEYRGGKSANREVEWNADAFAAELLMPEKMLAEIHESLPFPTVGAMAYEFEVSRQAMQIRLDHLGYSYVR